MIVMEVDVINVGKRPLTPSLMTVLPASGRHDAACRRLLVRYAQNAKAKGWQSSPSYCVVGKARTIMLHISF